MSRMRLKETAPEPYAALAKADMALRKGPLEQILQELVKLRASQLNGCVYCIDQHSKAARALGVTEDKLTALADWPLAAEFDVKERVALAYTDAVTRAVDVSDELWDTLEGQFAEDELGHLVILVALINAYNRFGIPLRMRPASRRPDEVVIEKFSLQR